MANLQKIQSNHAFKMLKDMGYNPSKLSSKETTAMLKKMGFKVESVRKNAKSVSTFIGLEVDSILEKDAKALGISKASLIRDVLYKHIGKKSKIL